MEPIESHHPCRWLLYTFFIVSSSLIVSSTSLQLPSSTLGNHTDWVALLKFKEMITAGDGSLDSWNDSIHFCSWTGITCGRRHRRVVSLDLEGRKLLGTFTPHIGNLSFLRLINLTSTGLRGEIPQELGKLLRLQHLHLDNNTFQGEIPRNLSSCSKLRTILLSQNRLVGSIPAELGSLRMLQRLILGQNSLTGEIPTSFANLTSLEYFIVDQNKLVGSIPAGIGKLRSLKGFSFESNRLSGTIPESFFNHSALVFFAASDNLLGGELPETMGLSLPSLELFCIGKNNFSGTIPTSITNATQLATLEMAENFNLVGQVPTNLGNLQGLVMLKLNGNNLGSNSSDDLNFISSLYNCSNLGVLSLESNNFGGSLPESIGNLSRNLNYLYLGSNQIRGVIPGSIQNLANLVALGMENNLLAGSAPSLGNLQKLQILALRGNRLSGNIPSSIGNLTYLGVLDLALNNFAGGIPSSISNCKNLYLLDLGSNDLSGHIPPDLLQLPALSKLLNISRNNLIGNLPAEVGKLASLNVLDVSGNNLSGEIPATIRDCFALEYLHLERNSFTGNVPSSLTTLRGLLVLDLSCNNLTGRIPKYLQNLTGMLYMNISFNDLEGEVPIGGIFSNSSAISLAGNVKLCGGIAELELPSCPKSSGKKLSDTWKSIIIIITTISGVILLVCLVTVILVVSKKRSKARKGPTALSLAQLTQISFKALQEATGGFSSDNFVGSGSFGSVYRGFLEEVENMVAIKVINLQRKGAAKSIEAECNILKQIRHRNLVKLLTFCSSLDFQGNEFKALVYEFIPNGSLDSWLYPSRDSGDHQGRSLSLDQRLNIVLDVGNAMHYLHDLCETSIVHCDLKPGNVLLDDDMVAHVGDFGLARFLAVPGKETSTSGVKGTVGYVAPEYGIGGAASKEGDVYSYGILVLEIFTGRKPTDDMFKEGGDLNLHGFVKEASPQRIMQVLDPTLFQSEESSSMASGTRQGRGGSRNGVEVAQEVKGHGEVSHKRLNDDKCLVSVLEIGLSCSAESPKERPTMGEVTRRLQSIKETFLRGSSLQKMADVHYS